MFKQSLVHKMILIYFMVLLLPTLCISFFSYDLYKNSLERNVLFLTEQILKQAGSNLQVYLDEASKLTLIPYSNSEIINFLKGDTPQTTSSYWPLKQQDLFNGISFSHMLTSENIVGIFLYSHDGRVFYQTRLSTIINNKDYSTSTWYPRLMKSENHCIVLGTHKEENFVQKPYVISIVRAIYDYDSINTPIGTIIIDLDNSVFAKIAQKAYLGKGSRLLVTDENGSIIFDTQGLASLGDSFEDLSLRKKDFYVYRNKLQDSEWTIIGIVPANVVIAPVRIIGYWILALFIVCLIFGLILLLGATFGITKPIRKLHHLMHQMENGDLNIRYEGLQKDEIGELGKGFNTMSGKIKTLIEDVYQAEISLKNAQLAELKSEINPHFLFNALESIHMRAELGDTKAISKITLSLSNLLRSSIKNKNVTVSLKEELESVRDYLNIILFHYKDRFQIQYIIPDDLYEMRILRFILQPILENAIKHGVEKQSTLTSIWLKVEVSENCILITIENDGPSIPPGRLERLQLALGQENGPWYGGIGMMNVHKRIQLFYAQNYGISIRQRLPDGVIVEMRLPVLEENR